MSIAHTLARTRTHSLFLSLSRFRFPFLCEDSLSSGPKMQRLVQELASLSSNLPLELSSSVFLRVDSDRPDVMQALITGTKKKINEPYVFAVLTCNPLFLFMPLQDRLVPHTATVASSLISSALLNIPKLHPL